MKYKIILQIYLVFLQKIKINTNMRFKTGKYKNEETPGERSFLR